MKVYKFGGASVREAEGVRNLLGIIRTEQEPLFVVVSAMGKTTNALEEVVDLVMHHDRDGALARFAMIESYHDRIIRALFPQQEQGPQRVQSLYGEVRAIIAERSPLDDYDMWYDRIVSYGELISTAVVSEYLAAEGIANRWIDMRRCFVTDSRHREANINVDKSLTRLKAEVEGRSERIFVGQGFIGATEGGRPTTLGREGSDYSAAMVAYLLDAESVSIWKDVEGILNADPRLFADPVHIPQLTYLDAIELAYSGAQVIHPKTIKPLQNKHIPLYVRPFADPVKPGSVICGQIDHPIGVPIFILKKAQVLISIRPKDFSFVLEERLPDIFSVFGQYRQKINLIQSSAVNLSLCVDDSRHLERVVEALQVEFRVVYNRQMELLTIRGYDTDRAAYKKYVAAKDVYLVQETRRTARIVRYGAQ